MPIKIVLFYYAISKGLKLYFCTFFMLALGACTNKKLHTGRPSKMVRISWLWHYIWTLSTYLSVQKQLHRTIFEANIVYGKEQLIMYEFNFVLVFRLDAGLCLIRDLISITYRTQRGPSWFISARERRYRTAVRYKIANGIVPQSNRRELFCLQKTLMRSLIYFYTKSF